MNSPKRQPVILVAVLAVLAGLLWAAPAQAGVRPAGQPANCTGYTSGPYTESPVSLVGFATTSCWNQGYSPSTWARGTMWQAPSSNGPWSYRGSAEGWGSYFNGNIATARVGGGGVCGSWYLMTGEHKLGYNYYWTSQGTPVYWPCS